MDRVAGIERACCDFRGFIRDGYGRMIVIVRLGCDALAFVS
jgi:hypothetical protein